MNDIIRLRVVRQLSKVVTGHVTLSLSYQTNIVTDSLSAEIHPED